MEAFGANGRVTLSMSLAEASVLFAVIAQAEFAEDLEVVTLSEPVEKKVFSSVQQTLIGLIPGIGTDDFAQRLRASYDSIDPGEYRL